MISQKKGWSCRPEPAVQTAVQRSTWLLHNLHDLYLCCQICLVAVIAAFAWCVWGSCSAGILTALHADTFAQVLNEGKVADLSSAVWLETRAACSRPDKQSQTPAHQQQPLSATGFVFFCDGHSQCWSARRSKNGYRQCSCCGTESCCGPCCKPAAFVPGNAAAMPV